jgi:hypothetical protein
MLGPDLTDLRSGDLRKAIRKGDKLVEKIVEDAAEYTGIAVANLINILNPQTVVLGGGVIDALGDEMMAIIVETAEDYILSGTNKASKSWPAKPGMTPALSAAPSWRAEQAKMTMNCALTGKGDHDPTIPNRRAVIDVGTNSVKLLVGDVAGSMVTPVSEDQQADALGGRVLQHAPIAASRHCADGGSGGGFSRTASKLGAAPARVIATSAARDALNADELTEAIQRACGLEVEVISGDKEADWVFRGVTTNPKLANRPCSSWTSAAAAPNSSWATTRCRNSAAVTVWARCGCWSNCARATRRDCGR